MSRFRLLDMLGTATLGVVLVAAILATARAQPSERLDAAEALYGEGIALRATDPAAAREKFRASAALLGEELTRTDTAGVRFNRANALLQADDLGDAIAEYRAAQLRSPSDERIAANLAEARGKVSRSLGAPEPTPLERACELWASVHEQSRLVIAVILGFAAVVLFRAGARASAIACIAAAMLASGTVAADIARRSSAQLAVVTDPTVVRKGNGDGFDQVVAEPLPIGTECRVREARPGWLEVALSGGTTGWVREASLARVE